MSPLPGISKTSPSTEATHFQRRLALFCPTIPWPQSPVSWDQEVPISVTKRSNGRSPIYRMCPIKTAQKPPWGICLAIFDYRDGSVMEIPSSLRQNLIQNSKDVVYSFDFLRKKLNKTDRQMVEIMRMCGNKDVHDQNLQGPSNWVWRNRVPQILMNLHFP